MSAHRRSPHLLLTVVAGAVLLQGCLVQAPVVQTVTRPSAGSTATIATPLRVQMTNGEIVRFPDGAVLTGDSIRGAGTRHDLSLTEVAPVTAVALDQVTTMVNYRRRILTGQTLMTNGAVIVVLGLIGSTIEIGPTVDLSGINWIGY